MKTEIKSLIEKYAGVYADFEKLQKLGKLPSGDQKTGVIAEYYAKCYIEKSLGFQAEYAKPGESFDLSFLNKGNKIKIQVKGVSAHSKTRIIAPLNIEIIDEIKPFDYLYLISLDLNFKPDGFYINSFDEIMKRLKEKNDERKKIQGAQMKGKNKSGYWLFDFKENKEKDLNSALI